jgi:hypothetical protein
MPLSPLIMPLLSLIMPLFSIIYVTITIKYATNITYDYIHDSDQREETVHLGPAL